MSTKEAKPHVEQLLKDIKLHDAAWDETFRHALARNRFSKWLGESRPYDVAVSVADAINAEFGYEGDDAISVEWFDRESEKRRDELIASQDACCGEIDAAKESLESATERKKAAQSVIDEGHSRLRFLARELQKPFTFPLPSPPSRQRELPLADGEEWRVVLLADVLADDVTLKAIALEKLGNINLGAYAEAAQKFGVGDKPKKLTRKQWDKVEALVQAWHDSRDEQDESDDSESDA